MKKNELTICVVGLGYVGLPLATLLSKHFTVSGFDTNTEKIQDLKNGLDRTGEVVDLSQYQLTYSADPTIIKAAAVIIIAVPTPITKDNQPDLEPLKSASEIVGQQLAKGSIVVYESTVYPGCTEEVCLPILERASGLKFGTDFQLGYSPERVNPGDKKNTIDKITKVVSASDEQTLETLKRVYGSITTVFPAASIKVAEAAKVIENVQRSLNIALMNELAIIFDKLGISTKDVLEAAGTKWNFQRYTPGLVGGHCIGVDPYYLTYKAKQVGYTPKVILSGQAVNEYMSELVASKFKGRKKVLIMGLTFKENVPDTRNSKAGDLVSHLKRQGSEVRGHDPVLKNILLPHVQVRLAKAEMIDQWPPAEKFDGIILFSPHAVFNNDGYSLKQLALLCEPDTVLFDVKGFYEAQAAQAAGFTYLTL